MNFIALKMLIGDRAKYLGIVMGLTFASLLLTQQSGIFVGLMSRTFGFLTDTSLPDIWVMDEKVQFVDDVKPLRARRIIDGSEIDEGHEETVWIVAEIGHGFDVAGRLDRQGQFVEGCGNPADGAGQCRRYCLAELFQAAVHHDFSAPHFKNRRLKKILKIYAPVADRDPFRRPGDYRSIVPVRRIFFWRSKIP